MSRNIVDLSPYLSAAKSPHVQSVEAYWEGLRAGADVPKRSAVDPRGIESALEYAFILERIAPGHARFRLAGMHLVDLMGMEVRGMPLTAFFVPEARKALGILLEQGFDGPEIVEISLVAEAGFGKPDMTATLLLLPLRSDFGDVTRMLGCLVSDGRIGRTPRRFDLAGSQRRAVPPALKPATDQLEHIDERLVKAPVITTKPEQSPAPYLRLVTSND